MCIRKFHLLLIYLHSEHTPSSRHHEVKIAVNRFPEPLLQSCIEQFFHIIHLPHDRLIAFLEEKSLVITVILLASIFVDKPDTIIIGIQLRDQCHHFLALPERILHKVKDMSQRFRSPCDQCLPGIRFFLE